jgi:histidinol dehydrogenase
MKLARHRLDRKGAEETLRALVAKQAEIPENVISAASWILRDVRNRGDLAVAEATARVDGITMDPRQFEIAATEIERLAASVDPRVRDALAAAAARIEDFHLRQVRETYVYNPDPGHPERELSMLGMMVNPVGRVGIYAPGGKAQYPSTVLMCAIPARIAGVREIIMATPPRREGPNAVMVAAAKVAGVSRIFQIGGSQAIAAMAYGTQTVPRVDKVVGPGNIYVMTAKRMIFGQAGIDSMAGPSELVVVADASANLAFVAADLVAQAEHDELAGPILITCHEPLVRAVEEAAREMTKGLSRRAIIEAAFSNRGAAVLTPDVESAIEAANALAPEHLSLQVADARQYLARIRNAGAVFIGRWSPVAAGDYCAGPNHVLPTSGTARFSSPLGVYDFVKLTSIVELGREYFGQLAPVVETIAGVEGLEAHVESIRVRKATK